MQGTSRIPMERMAALDREIRSGRLANAHRTPYAADLDRAFAKITTTLSDPITVDAQRLGEALSFRTLGDHALRPAIGCDNLREGRENRHSGTLRVA